MISIVIPTYNNVNQLITNLKQNLFFLKRNEVVIVNDYPLQSIKEQLKDYPDVMLVENKENLGFAEAVNTGISQLSNRYVMLLNDDVLLQDISFMNAVAMMKNDSNVFAVSFAQKEKNGLMVGKNIIYWKNGFFQHKKANDLKHGINGWAEGGSCIIDKSKYKQMGGFDSLYAQFYWEDIDLSYRAWKAGYQVLFDPSITVIHHHESTIGKQFKKNKIKTIAYRNQFIFIWKNIEDKKMLLSHMGRLIYSLPVMMLKDLSFVKGFWNALLLLPRIVAKRKHYSITDQDVLNKFK